MRYFIPADTVDLAMTTCQVCGAETRGNFGRGRPQMYCSGACKQRAYRAALKLPVELTALPRWVRWDLRRRGDRMTKVPLTTSGRLASSTDPTTWTTFSAARHSTVGKGYGFMLGAGIGCIDLDHCIEDGHIQPWASEIIAACPATFMERSQSGEGVHIFGLLDEGPGRRRGQIEVYSHARFIAMTGDRLHGAPARLGDLQEVRSMLA